MSLDVYLELNDAILYEANITHNLGGMAREAGIYDCLWRPEESGITHAKQLIDPLFNALKEMKSNPARFEQFNAPNNWGTYRNFVPWLDKYLDACMHYPEARISVSR